MDDAEKEQDFVEVADMIKREVFTEPLQYWDPDEDEEDDDPLDAGDEDDDDAEQDD